MADASPKNENFFMVVWCAACILPHPHGFVFSFTVMARDPGIELSVEREAFINYSKY